MIFETSHVFLGWTQCLLLACACYAALIVYRLHFHPLAKYPGPKLAAATKWYEFYYDFWHQGGGSFGREVHRMHGKYGPIIRINPDEIHIRDPEYFNTLYAPGSRRDKHYNYAKMTGIPEATFGTIDHDIHKLRRGPNMSMFSKRATYGRIQDLLRQEVESLSNQFCIMHDNCSVRDIRAMFLGFASVFSARYFLALRLDFQENEESLSQWYKTVIAIPKDTAVVKQFPWLPELGKRIPRAITKALAPPIDGILTLQDQAKRQAKRFLQSGKLDQPQDGSRKFDTPATLFDAIQHSNLPPDQKTYDRMWQEAFNVFFASVDTVSRSQGYAVYYLMTTNPAFYESVRAEIDDAMPDSNEIPDLRVLEKLPLLTATIKETIRCMQLISGRIPVLCPTEMKYGDWLIPPSTPLSMTPNDIHTDPTIFPDPYEFCPSRWLEFASDGQTQQLHTRLDRYWVPFSQGPRQCQGITMAWAMLYIGLATTLRRFEFALSEDFDRARDADIVADHFFGDPSEESRGIRVRVVGLRE